MAKTKLLTALGSVAALSMFAWSGTAGATAVNCDVDAPAGKNYMSIDDSQVVSCLDAGTGNINGNSGTDGFLDGSAGSGFSMISKSDASNPFNISYDQGAGTWSFDSSAWLTGTKLALAFKWGTGNTADEWFVFLLQPGVSSGDFEWFNIAMRNGAGGLSHMNLYRSECVIGTAGCRPPDEVPEPASLGLLGLGLLGLGLGRRKIRA